MRVMDVQRKCCMCGRTMLIKASEWKADPALMHTAPIACELHDDDGDDDDAAWESEHRLRLMEGWQA